MIFRKAKIEEQDFILQLYNHDRFKPYTAWDNTYPTMDNIKEDISNNNLFVLEDENEILGSIAINTINELDNEEEYRNEIGLEFARVIVNFKHRGNGYSKILIKNVEEEIKRRGYHHIHICVYENDDIALSLYQKLGYIRLSRKKLFDYYFILFKKDL